MRWDPLVPRIYTACSGGGLGISRKPWTEEESERLREIYSDSQRSALLEEFPGRTWASIRGRAQVLGVRRSNDRYHYMNYCGYCGTWHEKDEVGVRRAARCPLCGNMMRTKGRPR